MSDFSDTAPRPGATTCDVQHGFGNQRCIRAPGHHPPCRSRTFRDPVTGWLSHSHWYSEGGRFRSHLSYTDWLPANASVRVR